MNSFEFLLALGEAEPSLVEDTLDRAYGKVEASRRRGTNKLLRTVLIAAVITALLAATAYAANVLFRLELSANDETLSQSFGGCTTRYEDIGLIISFDGPDMCHRLGFKTSYLPSEPSSYCYYPDGEWYMSLCGEDTDELGSGGPIPYNISVLAASSTGSFIIGGKTEIVRTYAQDELQVIEISSDYTGTDFERGADGARFVILFDSANGYALVISSSLYQFDQLEKILAGMELYVYRETYRPEKDLDYGMINPGRG